MKRVTGIAAGLAFLGMAGCALAIEELTPEPGQSYRVIGVTWGDVLNIRTQPDPRAPIVGGFAADTTGIVVAGTRVEVDGAVWWQVVRDGELGWVNARYLTQLDAFGAAETDFPLRCTGTEPFWSLTLEAGEARFETPEGARSWSHGPLVSASGLRGRHAARLEADGEIGHISLWRNVRFCSDGMSDIGFPYEAVLAAPDGAVFGGCCLRAGN